MPYSLCYDHSIKIACSVIPSFVYKVVLVADGNFKADHVRQKSDGDVWLMDGAGMAPNGQEYYTFLASAVERYTVSWQCQS